MLKNEPRKTYYDLGARPKTTYYKKDSFSDSLQEFEEKRSVHRKIATKQRSLKEIGDQIDSLVQVVQKLVTSQEKPSEPVAQPVHKAEVVKTTGSSSRRKSSSEHAPIDFSYEKPKQRNIQ